jgi:uncharacterized protein YndB with AHSA1/START domain
MKHLTVLVQAGLVVIRRRGRDRWNHLNAVPLQQVHERWLQPYESQWAAALLRLKHESERQEQIGEAMVAETAGKVDVFHIEMEISIQAPRPKVYEAMTGDITPWFGGPYSTLPDAKGRVIEPRVGGRFYEDWGDGYGALWGTVTSIRKNEWLEFSGSCGMGGAVHGVVRIELEEQGGATLIKLSHRAMGEVNADAANGYTQGWTDLLGTRLKAWVERGERQR